MNRSEPHVVVSRVGTLASYLWVPSDPMDYQAARELAAQQERRGVATVVHTARHVDSFGLPEGWEFGRTDAECIRERLRAIESEMADETEAHETQSVGPWPTVNYLSLGSEHQALIRRLVEIEPPPRHALEAV